MVGVFNIVLPPNSTLTLPATKAGANRSLYYYQGKGLTVENRGIPEYHAVDVVSDKDITLRSNDDSAKILVLQGMPINEPVVQHGPFVMNTRAEIQQAFAEYQQTQFGGGLLVVMTMCMIETRDDSQDIQTVKKKRKVSCCNSSTGKS